MLELIKSLAVAVIMVPVVMAIMLGLIYGLGEVFNLISKTGRRDNNNARSHRTNPHTTSASVRTLSSP